MCFSLNTALKLPDTFLHWFNSPGSVDCEAVEDEELTTHGTAAVKMEREG